MKLKQLAIIVMILAFVIPNITFVSGTENLSNDYEIVEPEKNRLIDDLFAQRQQLEHDFEANRDHISRIDQQLIELGVEMLSASAVAPLAGDDNCMPLWEPVSSSTIQWTKRVLHIVFRGYVFDITVLEGVPISPESCLRIDYANVKYKAKGISAGIGEVIFSTTKDATIEFLSETLSPGISFLDWLANSEGILKDSLSESTVIDQVEGVALVSFSAHMKYVYVKPYQGSDNMELYYFGNSVSCCISTASVIDQVVDGELVTYHSVVANVEDTVQSQYYDDYSRAAANYWDYHNNHNRDFKQDYLVYALSLNILGTTDSYRLPSSLLPQITE